MGASDILICENTDIDYLNLTGNFMYRNSDADVKIVKYKDLTLIIDESQPNVGNYNRVRGLTEENVLDLAEVMKIYKGYGIECPAFDFIKKDFKVRQYSMMKKIGCEPIQSYQRLFLNLALDASDKNNLSYDLFQETDSDQPVDIVIKLVKTSSELKRFDELFFSNEGEQDSFKLDEFYNFIAYENKKAVGFASLFVKNNIGYILDDFTLKEHRGKGIHKNLIAARIKTGYKLNLKAIYTDVELESISHINMKKCGLKDLVKKEIWLRT